MSVAHATKCQWGVEVSAPIIGPDSGCAAPAGTAAASNPTTAPRPPPEDVWDRLINGDQPPFRLSADVRYSLLLEEYPE